MLLSLSLLGAIASPTPSGPAATIAPLPHTFAAVNDTRSHGQVGDAFLSLNEAIQLHNQTLTYNQLSAAEQAQLALIPGTGTATFVSWARIDASVTPTIIIEQDLDVIVNTTYGLFFSCDNGRVVLDFTGANITRGMRGTTNSLQMRDLVFFGGPYGLDVEQTDISGQIGLAVHGCEFLGQSQWGVRVSSNTPNGFGKVWLESCEFNGSATATGVVWDGSPAGRTSFFDIHDCRMKNVDSGISLVCGAGGLARYVLDRVVIHAGAGSQPGVDIHRAGDRPIQLFGTHVEARAATGFRLDGPTTGATTVQLRMLQLWSTSGQSAVLGGTGEDLHGVLEDSTFQGAVTIRTGGGALPLTVQNIRCDGGTVAFDTNSAQSLTVIDSRFDGGAVQCGGPTSFSDCCFVNSPLSGGAAAPVTCTDSFVPSAGPNVTVNSPRPAEQLGGMHVLPDIPTIGSTVTFQADLPPGLFGFFLLGFTDPSPLLPWPQPLHVYGMVNATWVLPGVYRNQQSLPWTIPNWPIYIGLDLVAQIAILPDPNVSALPVQLAPGRRFALQ